MIYSYRNPELDGEILLADQYADLHSYNGATTGHFNCQYWKLMPLLLCNSFNNSKKPVKCRWRGCGCSTKWQISSARKVWCPGELCSNRYWETRFCGRFWNRIIPGRRYTKQNVLEVNLIAALKTISNYTNHIADTPLDEPFQAEKVEFAEV